MKAAIIAVAIATLAEPNAEAFKILQKELRGSLRAKFEVSDNETKRSTNSIKIGGNASKFKVTVRVGKEFGSSKCPCVGISGIEGSTLALIGNESVKFAADLGASCNAWDNDVNPFSCKEGQKPGKDNGWCREPWCYVDPCNCELDEPATKSPADAGYLPGASYQGKGLWYSYATCGGKDYWLDPDTKKKQQAEPKTCDAPKDQKWGNEKCRCIGIDGQNGTTDVMIRPGKQMAYPANTGASCSNWDQGLHPECTSTHPPDWCSQSWCYVDPCECSLQVPPKTSAYLPHALGNGRPVYYSYDTCGGMDHFSKEDPEACVNIKSEIQCKKVEKCAWDGKECLGKELVEVCDIEIGSAAEEKSESSESGLKGVSFTYGLEKCPCVGIAFIEGSTIARLDGNTNFSFPADLGAACKAWDNDVNPFSCKEGQKPGKDNGWCREPWCYVDPCNCELDEPATKSPADAGYLPGASYQGKGLWYSYATCGGKDYWMTDAVKKKAHQEKPKTCGATSNPAKWGKDKCKCIGIDGQRGSTNFSVFSDVEVAYPADAGASCSAWDGNTHPDCKGSHPPNWCKESWCYVDPCECDIGVPPKTSVYLPAPATANGRPVYYSYKTCGGTDFFVEKNDLACVHKKSGQECEKADKCAWNGNACLGKELVGLCGKEELKPKERASAKGFAGSYLIFFAVMVVSLPSYLM